MGVLFVRNRMCNQSPEELLGLDDMGMEKGRCLLTPPPLQTQAQVAPNSRI